MKLYTSIEPRNDRNDYSRMTRLRRSLIRGPTKKRVHSDPLLLNSLSKWQRTTRGSKGLEVGKSVRQNRIDNANVVTVNKLASESSWVKHGLEWIIGVDP